jgi:hypothetical protein
MSGSSQCFPEKLGIFLLFSYFENALLFFKINDLFIKVRQYVHNLGFHLF